MTLRASLPSAQLLLCCVCSTALSLACFEDPLPSTTGDTVATDTATSGDGDGDTSGDGDGDPAGDGDGDTSGDGDGDTSGDGDGDTSGDGDGDTSGDGDGDPGACDAGPYAVEYDNPIMLATGANPQGVVVGDVNNDGNLDIVASSNDEHELRVWFGSGTGNFSAPVSNVLGSMVSPSRLHGGAIADGVFDVVLIGYAQVIGVLYARLRGDGNGNWNDYESSALLGDDLALGRVDGDAALDLLIPSVGQLRFIPGTIGQESFMPLSAINSPAPWTTNGEIAAGTIDGDDELDVAVTTFGQLYIGSGDGLGGFEFGEQELTFVGPPTDITLGDTDGDGDLDVIITTAGGGTDAGHMFLGFGNGGFENEIELPAPSGPRGLTSSDINKDGMDDLAMIGDGNMAVYISTGEGNFAPAIQRPCDLNQRQVALADLNGDCVDDVVSVSTTAVAVCVMLSN